MVKYTSNKLEKTIAVFFVFITFFSCTLRFLVSFFELDCGTKESKYYLGFSGPHSNSQALGVGGSALKAEGGKMSGNQQNAGQSGQQGSGSGQQQQGSGSGQQPPAPMSDQAKDALANLVGSFLAAGFTATIVDPKEDKKSPT